MIGVDDEANVFADLFNIIRNFMRQYIALLILLVSGCFAHAAGQETGGAAKPDLPNPSLGIGLSEITDYGSELPFIDMMKMARPWIGHLPGKWGGWDNDDLKRAGYLDSHGWLKKMPKELEAVATVLLVDVPAEAVSARGRYRLTFEGKGNVDVQSAGRTWHSDARTIWFEATTGPGTMVILTIHSTDPQNTGDYVRDIKIVHERNIAAFEAGEIFNPKWLELVANMRLVRFMDWMQTNNSSQQEWEDRPGTEDYTYALRGAPVEVMLALCNKIGADPWFNMPHLASHDYIRNFATMVRDGLRKDLVAHVEYSNEVWNWTFGQASWAEKQARARWGKENAWVQFSAMKAVEMAIIWDDVFRAEPNRLVKIVSTQSGWLGLEEDILGAPLWVAEDPARNLAPASYFNAYAITGYFGGNLADDKLDAVRQWIKDSHAEAERNGTEQGLSGAALSHYVAAHRFDAAIAIATRELQDGSVTGNPDGTVASLANRLFPYQKQVADTYGLRLVMYEGGTHVTGTGAIVDDSTLTDFFIALNYSQGMGILYEQMLAAWRANGGTVSALFVDVMPASKWGSWGALRHLDDTSSRWTALTHFNTSTPAWWDTGRSGAFLSN